MQRSPGASAANCRGESAPWMARSPSRLRSVCTVYGVAGMRPGDQVLIVGAGAIGLAIAFWARRLGAREVIMADLHRLQEQRAMDLGATAFFTSDEALGRRVGERCPGGPDIVFECVGKPGLIDFCISLVRPRGKVVVLGLCTSPDHMDSSARSRRRSISTCRFSSTCMSSPKPLKLSTAGALRHSI